MTGIERQRRADTPVLGARELMTKIREFAVSSSVNGHAQAAVIIRIDAPQGHPGCARRPAATP